MRYFLWALWLSAIVVMSEMKAPVQLPDPEVTVEIIPEEPVPIVTPQVGVEILDSLDGEILHLRRVSAYNAVPAQTEGDPNVSSCGPNLPRQVALSRDLFFDDHGRKHLCGVQVTIVTDRGEVFHNYTVWDTMAPRFTLTADILMEGTDPSTALAFGVTPAKLIFLD